MNKQLMNKAIGTIANKAGRNGLIIKKYSPEILLGLGITSIAVGTIKACQATLAVDDVLEDMRVKKAMIEEGLSYEDEDYTSEDAVKDTVTTNVQAAMGIAKLYIPALAFTGMGLACVLNSHKIMKDRNIAIMASYALAEEALSNYRERVKDKLGQDDEENLFKGLTDAKIKVDEIGEDGKSKKVTKEIKNQIDDPISQYARFFDVGNKHWVKTSPEYNLMFLRTQQNYANDLLKIRGHVFLNEVYDLLGLERSQQGALVGWVLSDDGTTDNYIDFGLYNNKDESARNFINGIEESVLLDFNVDGIIYNLI